MLSEKDLALHTSVANVRNDAGVSPVFLKTNALVPIPRRRRLDNLILPHGFNKQHMLQRVLIIFVWWWQLKSHKNQQKGKYLQGLCPVQNMARFPITPDINYAFCHCLKKTKDRN